MPFTYNCVSHIALVCKDVDETIEFYVNKLNMPLLRSVRLPAGARHLFFQLNPYDRTGQVAFFWFPDGPPAAPGIASQHYDKSKGAETAVGSMNHLAFDVSPDAFDEFVSELARKGIRANTIDHTDETGRVWIRSVYFFDPNGIKLEFAALVE